MYVSTERLFEEEENITQCLPRQKDLEVLPLVCTLTIFSNARTSAAGPWLEATSPSQGQARMPKFASAFSTLQLIYDNTKCDKRSNKAAMSTLLCI